MPSATRDDGRGSPQTTCILFLGCSVVVLLLSEEENSILQFRPRALPAEAADSDGVQTRASWKALVQSRVGPKPPAEVDLMLPVLELPKRRKRSSNDSAASTAGSRGGSSFPVYGPYTDQPSPPAPPLRPPSAPPRPIRPWMVTAAVNLNRSLPPELQKSFMRSFNLEVASTEEGGIGRNSRKKSENPVSSLPLKKRHTKHRGGASPVSEGPDESGVPASSGTLTHGRP
uniref:Uncharacterized protein n=1 Tax=Neospora caninum (strain Liverpool) TaxID=572307 RepID=A0A0F7UM22_NEOCL|nr:TPA: hypothetical protein BN1204_049725 [Neospora caninum Liverpool]